MLNCPLHIAQVCLACESDMLEHQASPQYLALWRILVTCLANVSNPSIWPHKLNEYVVYACEALPYASLLSIDATEVMLLPCIKTECL